MQESHGSEVIRPQMPQELPEDMQGFNWGAFFLQWVWGIRHKVSWAWWSLIPGVNIVIAFMLGFQGNELAWKNCEWHSEAHFDTTESEWTRWGIGIFIIGLLAIGLALTFLVSKNVLRYELWRYINPGW